MFVCGDPHPNAAWLRRQGWYAQVEPTSNPPIAIPAYVLDLGARHVARDFAGRDYPKTRSPARLPSAAPECALSKANRRATFQTQNARPQTRVRLGVCSCVPKSV